LEVSHLSETRSAEVLVERGEQQGLFLHTRGRPARSITDADELAVWLHAAREKLARERAERLMREKLLALRRRHLESRLERIAEARICRFDVVWLDEATLAEVVVAVGPVRVEAMVPIEGEALDTWLDGLPALVRWVRRVGPNVSMTIRPAAPEAAPPQEE
jgi:hypothetical protein